MLESLKWQYPESADVLEGLRKHTRYDLLVYIALQHKEMGRLYDTVSSFLGSVEA